MAACAWSRAMPARASRSSRVSPRRSSISASSGEISPGGTVSGSVAGGDAAGTDGGSAAGGGGCGAVAITDEESPAGHIPTRSAPPAKLDANSRLASNTKRRPWPVVAAGSGKVAPVVIGLLANLSSGGDAGRRHHANRCGPGQPPGCDRPATIR